MNKHQRGRRNVGQPILRHKYCPTPVLTFKPLELARKNIKGKTWHWVPFGAIAIAIAFGLVL